MGAMLEAEGPKKRREPKVDKHVEIKRGQKGGYISKHHFEGYQHEPEEYPHKTFGELVSHLKDHFGEGKKGEEGSAAEESSESRAEAKAEGDED